MNKNIEKLIKLSKENPEMEIITTCNGDLECEEGIWFIGRISRIGKDYVWSDDERTFIDKTEITERLYEVLDGDCERWPDDYEITDADVEQEFKSLQKSGEIKEKIIIYIDV